MRKKVIISLFLLAVSNVAFAIPAFIKFVPTSTTSFATPISRVSATTLVESELPADISQASPSETPVQSLDEEPGELESTIEPDTGPVDNALIEPDASPSVNLERPPPLQASDRALAPPPVTPQPGRLSVPPAGVPILPTLKPVGPADESP